jgi:hypothetical protein
MDARIAAAIEKVAGAVTQQHRAAAMPPKSPRPGVPDASGSPEVCGGKIELLFVLWWVFIVN